MKLSARVPATVAVLAAAGAIAAGCGNEEQNDYVDQVNGIQTTMLDELTTISSSSLTNLQEIDDALTQMSDTFGTASEDLAAIDPPEEVADLHDQLVAETDDVAQQIGGFTDSFSSGNQQQIVEAASEMTTELTEAQTTLTEIVDEINAEFGA